MTIFLVLDILLILLILLFTPIGFWRGPVKELFVTLGIIFGVLLADFWARPWGRDLTDYTELTAGSGAFIVAMTFLVASTFILGYGLGATLAPAYHATFTRLLGAAIAAFNGALLLSFSLQYVRLHLLSTANEESLDDSFMARFLLDGVGWLLLLVAFVALPVLLFLLISGRRAYEPEYDEYEYYEEDEPYLEPAPQPVARQRQRVADAQTNVLPPRVPGAPREDASTYKAEPAPRHRRASAETRPLVVTDPQETSEPVRPRRATRQPRPATPAPSPEPSAEPGPQPELESEPEPELIIEPAPQPQPQPDPAPEPATQPQPQPQPEPRRQEPEPESEPESPPAPRPTRRPTPSPARMGDTDPHIVLPTALRGQGRGQEPPPAPPEPEPPSDESGLAPGYVRCVNCHAVLSPDISICPNCGTLR